MGRWPLEEKRKLTRVFHPSFLTKSLLSNLVGLTGLKKYFSGSTAYSVQACTCVWAALCQLITSVCLFVEKAANLESGRTCSIERKQVARSFLAFSDICVRYNCSMCPTRYLLEFSVQAAMQVRVSSEKVRGARSKEMALALMQLCYNL